MTDMPFGHIMSTPSLAKKLENKVLLHFIYFQLFLHFHLMCFHFQKKLLGNVFFIRLGCFQIDQ